jgi:uncharacterized protein involved in exopolysaccharide biosynthesis
MTFANGAPMSADPFTRPDRYTHDDDVIDLAPLLAGIRSNAVLVVAAAIACASIAAVYSATRPGVYEATAAVILSQSKIGDHADPASLATFQPLLQSRSIAAAVIREFGLDKPPRNVSTTQFFDSMVSVEQVRNSTVFLVRTAFDDPDLAARIGNRVAENAIEMSRRVSQQEALRSRDDLLQQRDEAKTRLDDAVEALRKFRETSQIELVQKDVDAMLGQRGELLGLLIQIESEKAKLAKAEQELTTRQRIGTVKRSIESDPAMLETARKSAGSSADLLSLETRNEFVDPVYENLDTQVATSRTTLAALERKRAQVVDVRRLDSSQLGLLTRLYDLEGAQARLEMERDLAMTVYRQVATAYETARVQVASRSAQLELLDRAVPPDRPNSKHVLRNTLVALVAGFALGVAAAVVVGMRRG